MTREPRPIHLAGFTLIELLVAMALFVILAGAMYGGTQWIMDEREIVSDRAGKLEALQRTVRLMHSDFNQAYPRAVRDELGRGQVAAMLSERSRGLQIRLTRSGWRNPSATNRGHLQRVQYRYDDEAKTLYRDTWATLDRVLGAEPREQTLLENVQQFDIEFLDVNGNWLQDWPAANESGFTTLPRALRYRIETDDFGAIQRIVEIPG
jgi:general secretion pathway protein J